LNNSTVIPGKLAIASATGIQENQKLLDTRASFACGAPTFSAER